MTTSEDQGAGEPDQRGDGGDAVARDAARWLADAHLDEGARARVRERWLRQQAEEDARLAGTLLGLHERGERVVVSVGAEVVSGTIAEVGPDAVALIGAGEHAVVAIAAITTIAAPGMRAASDSREATTGRTLAALVAFAAAERPDVSITAGGATVAGRLIAAGHDVVSVLTDETGEPAVVYVPLASVSLVRISG